MDFVFVIDQNFVKKNSNEVEKKTHLDQTPTTKKTIDDQKNVHSVSCFDMANSAIKTDQFDFN